MKFGVSRIMFVLVAALALAALIRAQEAEPEPKKIAVIANVYTLNSHADAIATKFFTGFPGDDGLTATKVKVVSMYIEQPRDDGVGQKLAAKFGVPIYPTIAEALTLGGEELAVDGVLYVGEHGRYASSRLGVHMYPHLNHLDQVFRVFDASDRAVPVFCDKNLAYSWLDSKWIYDRAKELGVPLMAGSCLPVTWRSPQLQHPVGAKITEAVVVAHGKLDSYGLHGLEMLQCMLERRAGGETGVASVECLRGQAVYEAAEQGKFSMELAEAASSACRTKKDGTMQQHEKNPVAILIRFNDGTKAAVLLAGRYVRGGRGYAAAVDGETVSCEFIVAGAPPWAHFSYLGRNIETMFLTGEPQYPVERTLLTSGILDAAARSLHQGGKPLETPHLGIRYEPYDLEPIRPTGSEPTGASLGPWPPEGLEFLEWERKRR